MATTSDIRDIMDMGHDGPRQPAPKRKKRLIDVQPRLTGISREVQALMGDSVPPVAIVETPKYKAKPSIMTKMLRIRHWGEQKFVHGARKDGLQLRHWKRTLPGPILHHPTVATGSPDAEMEETRKETQLRYEDEYPSERWDVKVPVPTYNDEQYEKNFKSEDWSREETDYLFELCRNFDLRWVLIADRYDPNELVERMDINSTKTPPSRLMEDLKARYYAIALKMLEIQIPASQMTSSEFQLWEKMRNFDAKAEATRKAMAEKLFERTREEAEEERVLLEELHRITKHEEEFIKMRKDLYTRLETAPSLKRNERGDEQSTAVYQTSQGLSHLLSTLLAREKRLKRPQPNGPEQASAAAPVDPKSRQPTLNRRETIDSQADDAASSKKGSAAQPVVRTLTPAEQAKYGVSHPQEKLTSGVTFRHEKIHRVTTAKSQVQTQKIQAALTELGIPPRLLMPTERVCREFERLVGEVQLLLDTRRLSEKVAAEIKILEEHKRIRLGLPRESDEIKEEDAMEVDESIVTERKDDNSEANSQAGDESTFQNGEHTQVDEDEAENDQEENDEDDEDEDGTTVNKSPIEDDEDAEGSDAAQDDNNEIDLEDGDDDDDDAPGLEDLEGADRVTDDGDEEANSDDEGEDEDDEDGQEDEDAEDDEENVKNPSHDADNVSEDDEEDDGTSRDIHGQLSARSADVVSRKRSASMMSDASKSSSDRSGAGRKKRR